MEKINAKKTLTAFIFELPRKLFINKGWILHFTILVYLEKFVANSFF
jgi:hypothetical protein